MTLDEDCAELRKLSRVYEIVVAGLPENSRTAGEAEAMLHYNELLMSVYDALRDASIRIQNFAQAQPGQPPPPWEQQRPSFTVYRRVHYGMLWGMAILSVGIFLRFVRFYAAYQLTDEATGLNCIELRVACEQQWHGAWPAEELITPSPSAESCDANGILILYAVAALIPPVLNLSLLTPVVPWLIFRNNFNYDSARSLIKEVSVLLIFAYSLGRIILLLLLRFDPMWDTKP